MAVRNYLEGLEYSLWLYDNAWQGELEGLWEYPGSLVRTENIGVG